MSGPGIKGQKDNSRRKYQAVDKDGNRIYMGGARHNPVGLDARRADAIARDEAWRALSPEAQLRILAARSKDERRGAPGTSARQVARIRKAMEKKADRAPQAAAQASPVEDKAKTTKVKAKDRRAAERKASGA